MTARFSEAIRILRRHAGLFAPIILTVWLPGNILAGHVIANVEGFSELDAVRLTMLIEGIFGPLYVGALVHALFRIQSGQAVTYREAMTVGLRKWGTLLIARLAAGLFVLLGLIALVLPGMVLAVRYSLLDAAVIIEDKLPATSRARSTVLTAGRRWQIFWSAVLFFLAFFVLTFVLYLPLDLIEPLNTMTVEVVLNCILDVAYAVIQIVIFLFYWEAVQAGKHAVPAAGESGSPVVQVG